MNGIQSFSFEGAQVRTVLVDGDPWWVANDVCAVIGIVNVGNALARLDEDEKGSIRLTDGTPGNPNRAIVNEPGLYSLLLRSDKPQARAFKRWITHEVIPAIRRTGRYEVSALGDELAEIEAANARSARAVAIARAERDRADKAEAFKTAIEAGDGLTLRSYHKKYFSALAEKTFMAHLYERGYLIDQRGKGPGREDGTTRNGSQHRHPTAKGKPYLYLHGHGEIGGKRRENTRVRPGQPELDLKAALVKDGLAANNNDTGQPRAIGTVQASLMGSEAV